MKKQTRFKSWIGKDISKKQTEEYLQGYNQGQEDKEREYDKKVKELKAEVDKFNLSDYGKSLLIKDIDSIFGEKLCEGGGE